LCRRRYYWPRYYWPLMHAMNYAAEHKLLFRLVKQA
jgi:hypothetical protein